MILHPYRRVELSHTSYLFASQSFKLCLSSQKIRVGFLNIRQETYLTQIQLYCSNSFNIAGRKDFECSQTKEMINGTDNEYCIGALK